MGRKINVQCDANAHKVNRMLIHFESCTSLDQCVKLQTSSEFIDGLLETFEFSGEDEGSVSRLSEDYAAAAGTDDSSSIPTQQNRIESLNTWTVRRPLKVNMFHLVVCYASNEIGRSYTTKIIIPSELERGKTNVVKTELERAFDPQIVEGDSLKLIFFFNNVLFGQDNYKLVGRPPGDPCGLDAAIRNNEQNYDTIAIFDDNSNHKTLIYTQAVEVLFQHIKPECTFNYTLELQVNDEYLSVNSHDSLKSRSLKLSHYINVLTPIVPYFLEAAGKKNFFFNFYQLIYQDESNENYFISISIKN